MWRLFVYTHMMVWVVKYEVNYLNNVTLDSFQKEVYLVTVSYCIALLYLEPIIQGLFARMIL